MAYEPRDGSGALFKNEDKDDSHPNWADYKGDIMIDGKQYWLSAWVKGGEGGKKKFFSLSAEPKKPARVGVQTQTGPLNANNQGDKDLPF